jgi:hypothetical protein
MIFINSVITPGVLPIIRSEAKSWYGDDRSGQATKYSPEKAHDGNYSTIYAVKDNDAVGNFLKLYLSQKYRIRTVKLTNMKEGCCEHRILGTEVMVYFTEGQKEKKIANCGERITGEQFFLNRVNLSFTLYNG